MSYNLNNLIKEKEKELEEKIRITYYDWEMCKSYIDEEKTKKAKNFLRQSITEAVEKTLEEVSLKESTAIGDAINNSEGAFNPTREEVEREIGYNDAVSDFNRKQSNWLNK